MRPNRKLHGTARTTSMTEFAAAVASRSFMPVSISASCTWHAARGMQHATHTWHAAYNAHGAMQRTRGIAVSTEESVPCLRCAAHRKVCTARSFAAWCTRWHSRVRKGTQGYHRLPSGTNSTVRTHCVAQRGQGVRRARVGVERRIGQGQPALLQSAHAVRSVYRLVIHRPTPIHPPCVRGAKTDAKYGSLDVRVGSMRDGHGIPLSRHGIPLSRHGIPLSRHGIAGSGQASYRKQGAYAQIEHVAVRVHCVRLDLRSPALLPCTPKPALHS